jgi:hypothetical protein
VEQAALEAHALGQRGLEGAVDRLLGHHDDRLRQLGDLLGRLQRLVQQLGRGHDAADEAARSASAASIMRPVRTHLHRLRLADGAGQALRAAGARDHAEVISGWPNFAVSAARMKSHIIASSQPPPSAKPATAAITGLRQRVTRSHRS